MGHLQNRLQTWKPGDALAAIDLNWNFAALYCAIETTMAQARQPDQGGVEALQRTEQAERRIARLERREAATERERNERQYTPLAAHGQLLRQMGQLAGPLRQAAEQLRAECGTQRAAQGRIENRVAALEAAPPPPEAPSLAGFAALTAELHKARAEARLAAQQTAGLRAEVAALRKLVTDPDRGTNKRQYATLGAMGQLLHRIAALESRQASVASEAPTATAELREEVADLQLWVKALGDRLESLEP